LAANLILMFSGLVIFAQNPAEKQNGCTDETAQKISSRGINIGRNIDEILNLFAMTEDEKQQYRRNYSGKNPSFGYEFFGVSPANLQSRNEKFDGISDYTLNFLDNRLTGFSVSYTKPIWENNEQFTSKMAEIFLLPNSENWVKTGTEMLSLQCGNYRLETQTINNAERSIFAIYDMRIGKILEQRKRKAANEQREKDIKTFKP
jgi:hypothetical protein